MGQLLRWRRMEFEKEKVPRGEGQIECCDLHADIRGALDCPQTKDWRGGHDVWGEERTREAGAA